MDTSDELLQGADPAALLTPDGAVLGLNTAMATALGRSAEECLGRDFGDLWPAGQQMSAESLVAHAAKTKAVAMRVLDFPARDGAPVASLIEARSVKDPTGDEQLVWVRALDARNDLTSLLIPFRMATTAAHLGLWMYSPHDHQMEWLGGAPAVAALFPDPATSLSRVVSAVHPDDREALRQLLRSASAQESPWVRVRYLPQHEGWHQLAAQTRRIQLGYGGPERIFGLVRDDTKQEKRKEAAQAALIAERQRAKDIADFSSGLITAATEQELQQVALTRLAATFGASGALLALVEEGRLRVSTDAGIAMWEADVLHGLPLDHPSALPESIRTGKPQFIGTSAGHVPLLCAREDGSHSIRELPGGPVLGVVPDTEYGEETFTLDEDSALVMVTDGVVEGPGLTLDAGLERAGTLAGAALHDGLNAEQIADRVLDAAVAVDHLDDVAVLVIRRT
ncbi:SpoIIE family protein phosphatase [Streptomyces mirabilis]|uniref:SpoIIE family protein phosphatase n=1 Tax=Streptomyces mirabilis TaxID=68239 RepID=UPI0037B9555E